MKFLEDYREAKIVLGLLEEIKRIVKNDWVLMEICGGQTHAILQFGLDQFIPENIELVHGPGCPVCVTSLELVDKALAIASLPNVIFTTYGDMLRVPGSSKDLFSIKARGGKVRTVYSPLDAVRIAQENPNQQVVFFAIGFETTAPNNATSVLHAKTLNIKNYSILVSQMRVPPAMSTILSSPQNRVQGFLAPGHVCSIMGSWEYDKLVDQFRVPIVITGFEPLDLVNGILMTIKQLETGHAEVQNAYSRVVTYNGNEAAQEIIHKVFKSCNRQWRGIGMIPDSGWALKGEFAEFDAENRFRIGHIQTKESSICIAGEILQGLKKPMDCIAFGTQCSPRSPLGATMVSSEGTCAAYFHYVRTRE